MSRLPPGLYQSIVTEALARELASLEEGRALTQALHPAEAADRLTLHLARVIERSLEAVIQRREGGTRSDRGSSPPVLAAVDLARELVALLLARGHAPDLAFTLDKTDGRFSPTTRYRDYAISRELIHWESQSVTRADSDTGLRYQRHAQPEASGQPSQVLLFARMRASDRAFFSWDQRST
jgi:hypothetical protein